MRISVIIPTVDASASLGELLSMLLAQDAKPHEIIIIDSSSVDNTVDIAKKSGARTMVIPRQSFDHGSTRNSAAIQAEGDILVFMTQDALPVNTSLLRKLTEPLRMPDIAATFARHIPQKDAPLLEVFARQFNYPDKGMAKSLRDIKRYGIKTFFFSNVCSSIKKDLFLQAGLFPDNVRANEDMLIAAKLILGGYKVVYVPEAMVFHSHSYSLRQQFRRYFNIGSSLKSNDWILEYAQAEGEGKRFLREQVAFVLKHHKFSLLPYIFLESVTKYMGFRIGLIIG